jgi:exosortase/archaeosortase family protein
LAETANATDGVTRLGPPGEERPDWNWNRFLTPRAVLMLVAVAGLIVWIYGRTIVVWKGIWDTEDAWGHCYVIPAVAALIAHYRLREKRPRRIEPCSWGLVLILAGIVLRVWAKSMKFGYPGQVTFVLVVAGAVLWLLGWQMFKALWVPVAYLWLMIPWPQRIYDSVAQPAQRWAAAFTAKFLALVGYEQLPAPLSRLPVALQTAYQQQLEPTIYRAGNVLHLTSGGVTVAEACSGLHLLMAFVALGVMMAFIYKRPAWERIVIILSSVPIAVFCNFIRVTLMALASDGLFFEGQRLLAGQASWSAWVPRVDAWSGTAWVGLVVLLVGVFLLISAGHRAWFGSHGILKSIGLSVVGVVVVFLGAEVSWGYETQGQLESVRQVILDPKSAPHQAFGFAMLGLAFVLMWLERVAIDRLLNLIFIEEEEGAEAGAPGAAS